MLRLRRSKNKENNLLDKKKEKVSLKIRLKKIGPALVNLFKKFIFS